MKTRNIRLAIGGLALAPFAGLALGGPPAAGAATGSMTRAPYVTDLSQTGAEVNFATSAGTAGSVLAMPESAGTCPASIGTWTSAATVATTRTPYGPGQGTTGWKFTVGTVSEYQNSVRLSGLSPATTYCYAVFADHTAGTPDLLSGPGYQHFTTLASPSAGSTAPVSFDVIGDTGENFAQTGTDGNGGAVSTPFSASVDPSGVENPYQSALYGEIGKDFATGHSQFLLGTGDTSYNGGTETTLGDLQQPGTVAQAQGLNATEYSNIFGPTYLPEAGAFRCTSPTATTARTATVSRPFRSKPRPTARVAPTPTTATRALTESVAASRTPGTHSRPGTSGSMCSMPPGRTWCRPAYPATRSTLTSIGNRAPPRWSG